MSQNYLIYQAYGKKDIYHECIYSIYTLKTQSSLPLNICIYTDDATYLQLFFPVDWQIQFIPVTENQIQIWRGEHGFVHRFKIMMLLDFLTHRLPPGDHAVLYADTDTTFLSSVSILFDKIEAGQLLMHKNEGNIYKKRKTGNLSRKMIEYIESGKSYFDLIPLHQDMWNAGVLGFKTKDITLIKQVLETTDKVYSELSMHVVEQLVFSVVFGTQPNRTLVPIEKHVFHYWNFKEFRAVLAHFFEVNTQPDQIRQKLKNIDPTLLILPKRQYESSKGLYKLIKKASGRWKMPTYEV